MFKIFKKKSFENKSKKEKVNFLKKQKKQEIIDNKKDTKKEELISIPSRTKTLDRLDLLEEWMSQTIFKLNDISIKLNSLDLKHNKDIIRLEELIKNIPSNTDDNKADFVLDTTDSTYKNVKQIIIDNAINANQILYNGKYCTIDEVMQNYQPDINYVEHSGYADKIKYGDSIVSLETVIKDYIHKNDWINIINSATTFEQFKSNLINILSQKG